MVDVNGLRLAPVVVMLNISLSKAVRSSDSQYYANNAVQLGIPKQTSTVARGGRKQGGKPRVTIYDGT